MRCNHLVALDCVGKMKVICAGFWKTGTKSLAEALRILGYKVFDYDNQFFELEQLWTKFFDGTVTDEDIRSSLENVDVLIDGPVIAFWEEIHKVFPEAKVILTTRDEDAWFDSLYRMVDRGAARYITYVLLTAGYFTPAGHRFFKNAMGVAEFCLGTAGPLGLSMVAIPKSPRLCKLKFRKHNCYVKNTVSSEKLLEYSSVSGSWQPLCKFLGKGIPDIPYPHKNKLNALFKTGGFASHPGFKNMILQSLAAFSLFVVMLSFFVYHSFIT